MQDLVKSSNGGGKPCVLWFLYDYNDGGEQLQWLSQQQHDMIIIAPTAESYVNSSSKIAMKHCFIRDGIPTAPYTAKSYSFCAFSLSILLWLRLLILVCPAKEGN